MISGRRVVSGLIAIVLATTVCSGAIAQSWFEDNFDSHSIGILDGQGGWVGGLTAIRVQDEFAQMGKAVYMNYLDPTMGAGEANHGVTTDGGAYFVSFSVAMDTEAPVKGENLGYVKIYNSSGVEITRIYLAHQQLKVLLGPEPGTPVLLLDNTEMLVWYNVRMKVYPSINKLDVWVDGIARVIGGQTWKSPSDTARVGIAQWPNLETRFTKSELYIDRVVVEPDEDTARMALSPFMWMGWEFCNVMFPFVLYDETNGAYRMWYTGSGAAQFTDSNWDLWQIGIVSSTDGRTWSRRTYNYEPVLYATKFWQGDIVEPESNIFDNVFAFGGCVLRDEDTYKMWYTGWTGDSEHIGGGISGKINFRIGYAASPDGLEWTKHQGDAGKGSILGLGGAGDLDRKGVGQPYVIKEGSLYRMWYEGFDGSAWRIFYATSSDGHNWTKHGVVLNPGESGAMDGVSLRKPVVIKRNGHYELWYSGESTASPHHHVMRATSEDGLAWTKVPGEVELHPDDVLDGTEKMHLGCVLVNPDNSCRVYFAKENAINQVYKYGVIPEKKTYIYTEVVNP